MRYADTLLDLVGNTPLLRLHRLPGDAKPLVLAKVEYLSPGGSVKDRIVLRMVEAAEKDGRLRPGGTIVEPTSGNTGVGLAMVAQAKGYRCVFVCPDKVSEDKRNVLKAYGAEVVVCPTAVPPDSPDSYYSVSDRLAGEIEGGWKPDQYSNPENPAAHYESTGPEIWAQTEGRVTHFVAGVGTGGTITGAGRYLKEVSDGRVQVVGADPLGSVYSGGTGRPYLVEGVGEDMWPETYDPQVADRVLAVSDAESFEATRRLAREEALLVGGSGGMAAAAAVRLARELDDPTAVIVVLLPDGGRGYLGKVFDDQWMARHGFLRATSGRTVGDVLGTAEPAALPHVRPDQTLAEAAARLRDSGLAALPVVRVQPPALAGEVAGSVSEGALLATLASGNAEPGDSVADQLEEPLPLAGVGEPLSAAVERLGEQPVLLVLGDGEVTGLLARDTVLAALTMR